MNAFSYNDNNGFPHPKPFKVPMIFMLVTKSDKVLQDAIKVLDKHSLTFADFAGLKISY